MILVACASSTLPVHALLPSGSLVCGVADGTATALGPRALFDRHAGQRRGTMKLISADDQPEILRPVLARFTPGWRAVVGCGEGWWPIIATLDRDIAAIAADYQVHQIKEKFGGLRFYYRLPDGSRSEQINDLIRDAEATAARTCEICGTDGRLRTGRWLQTLCDDHARSKPAD